MAHPRPWESLRDGATSDDFAPEECPLPLVEDSLTLPECGWPPLH